MGHRIYCNDCHVYTFPRDSRRNGLHLIPELTGVGDYFFIKYTVDLPPEDTTRPWERVTDPSEPDADAELLVIKQEDLGVLKYYAEEVFAESQAEGHPEYISRHFPELIRALVDWMEESKAETCQFIGPI